MEQTCEEFIKIVKPLLKKYESEINKDEYRNLILDILKEYGSNGIKMIRKCLAGANINIYPFDMEIIKIIAELTSFA